MRYIRRGVRTQLATRVPDRFHLPGSVLSLFGTAVLIPVILFCLAAWNDHRQMLLRAERDAERAVVTLEEHATKVFETQELILDRIAERVRDLDWDEISASERSVHEYLRQMRLPQVSDILLVDPQGRIRASATIPCLSEIRVADRDDFVQQRSGTDGTYIDSVVKGRLTGQSSFLSSRRLSEPDGSFAGVIVVAIASEYFVSFWQSFTPSRDHLVVLFRSDNAILARHPISDLTRLPNDGPLMRAIRTAEKGVFHGRSPYDGIARVVGYRKLDRYPLYMAFGHGYPTILSGWYRNLAYYGLAALLAAAALILVIRYALRTLIAEQQAILSLGLETERRKRAEADLSHARKLEAIGAMTTGIAHDFGNFLQVIMLNLQVLRGKQCEERLETLVRSSLEASYRAATLRKHLLAFSRKQPLDPERRNVNEVIKGFLPILAHALGASIKIETWFTDDLWPIILDKGQLEVALLNLAVNAKHAMPNGGILTIETRNLTLRAGEAVDDLTGPFVAVSVADTGSGMPPDVLERAFEPFFTTKEEGKGTGLGLSAVYGFARASDGTATIRSTIGEGTVVTLYFQKH